MVAENKSSDTDSKSPIMIDATITFGSNKSRMYHAATQDYDFNFSKLASSFEEIRNELMSQYTGEELKEQLNLLDLEYEDTVDYMAKGIKQALNFCKITGGEEGEKKAIEVMFGKNIGDLNEILKMLGIEKGQSFMDSVDVLVKFLAQKARQSSAIS